jgi:hypothetical protein
MSIAYNRTFSTLCAGALIDTINATPSIGVNIEQIVDDNSGQLQFWFTTALSAPQQIEFDNILITFACPVDTDSSTSQVVVDDTNIGTNIIWTSTHVQQQINSGNVASASVLTTPRNIAISSDVTGSVAFDGSTNVNIVSTLSDTGVVSGTYGDTHNVTNITVDSKGRITSINDVEISVDAGTF